MYTNHIDEKHTKLTLGELSFLINGVRSISNEKKKIIFKNVLWK